MAINIRRSATFTGLGGITTRGNFSAGGLRVKQAPPEPAPFDPSALPGLVAWFRADTSAFIVFDNGATVETWPDDSSNNNDLNSYEGAPTYNASDALLNNKPSVTYNGSASNYRSNPTGLPTGSSACTTYVVGYWDGTAGNHAAFGWGANAYTGSRMSHGGGSGSGLPTPGFLSFESQGMVSTLRTISINTPYVFFFPYTAGASYAASTTYLNGIGATGAFTDGTPNIINPVSEITIGRPATAATERWTGAIAEVLVYNVTHGPEEYDAVQNYLGTKYGITILPPA